MENKFKNQILSENLQNQTIQNKKEFIFYKNVLGRWYFEDRYEKQTQCFYREKQTWFFASLFLYLFSMVS